MKILLFMFECPISNNKERKKYCPLSPWDTPVKNYFIEFMINLKMNDLYIPVIIVTMLLLRYQTIES